MYKLTLLDKHISNQVIKGSFSILFFLLFLTTLFGFLGELGELGKGSYTLTIIFQYITLFLPYQAYQFFPSAIVIGSLLTLGNLATQQNFTIWFSTGISISRIIMAALPAIILLMLLFFILGEILIPITAPKATLIKAKAKQEQALSYLAQDIWLRQEKSFVYIKTIVQPNQLQDITIHFFNANNQLIQTLQAKQALYNNQQWQLQEVAITYLTQPATTAFYKTYLWSASITPETLKVLTIPPEYRDIKTLAQYINYLEINNLNTKTYKLAFWQKIIHPFLIFMIFILILPIVIYQRGNFMLRFLIGISIGLLVFLALKMLGQIGQVLGMNPLFSALLPIFFSTMIIIWRYFNFFRLW